MPRCLFLLLVIPLWAAAQSPAPSINPGGIVRADTNRPGLFPPGMVISVYGHNFGPAAGCKGPAQELCGVQVFLGAKPLEIQYVSEIQINVRLPDETPGQPVSQLIVVSNGRRSDSVDVRQLPETATIALEGVARVHGPIWIHVELPRSIRVSYPALGIPWDFACDVFEVRRNGQPLIPLSPPTGGMAYSGPPCPEFVNQRSSVGRTNRLPLHLQYDLNEPGVYEVRLSHYGFLNRQSGDIRIQSAWSPIEVLPSVPRMAVAARPQEPGEVVSNFLPNLLALRNDETLSVLLEYVYHSSPHVRGYAAKALRYWSDAVLGPRLLKTLRAKGPTPELVERLGSHASELGEAALPYLSSSDPLLFQGAIAAARDTLLASTPISPDLRLRLERRLIAAATVKLGRADAQTINDLISVLGQIKSGRVHELLWSLVDRHIGTEQSLIAITWQKDANDLPRLVSYLMAAAAGDPSGRALYEIPYAIRAQFGDAALPPLRSLLENAPSSFLRIKCAEELMNAKDPSGFAFALDAVEHNRPWKPQTLSMVANVFPETRAASEIQVASFLSERSR